MKNIISKLLGKQDEARLTWDVLVKCVGWPKQDYYADKMTEATLKGQDFIMIPQSDYDEAMLCLEARRKRDEAIANTAARNNEGIAFEKAGETDRAIEVYEENIANGYPALHAFNRLMVLYRRRRDYANEIRVIKRAVEVFQQENERRAEKAIEDEPQLREQIQEAAVSGKQVMGSNGFYCFVPYDVAAFRERLKKTETLYDKQKQGKK